MKDFWKDNNFWQVVGALAVLGVISAISAMRGTGDFWFSVMFGVGIPGFVLFCSANS